MVEPEGEIAESPEQADAPRRRKRRWRVLGVLAGVSALGLGAAWLEREQLADKVIAGQLQDLGLPAKYEIESIGTQQQVLRNIVIGDPRNPDLTIERAVVEISPSFGLPTVSKITLLRPRLFGSYRQAKASFGSLDKLLFEGKRTNSGLPDMALELIDGRARIDNDYGVLGVKAEGSGNLQDGFSGIVAAVAPSVAGGGCTASKATLYGRVTINDARPRLVGPLRFDRIACPGQKLALGTGGIQIDVRTNAAFDSVDGKLGLSAGALAVQGQRASKLLGNGDFTLRGGDLTARYRAEGQGISAGWADASTLALDGSLRSHDRFARWESEGTLGGASLRPGRDLNAALAAAQRGAEGSLAAPLLRQIGQALLREGRGSQLTGSYVWRQTGAVTNLVVPRAVLRGGSGSDLLSLSRLQFTAGGSTGPHLSSNIRTGGTGLPRLEGRVERGAGGQIVTRFAMQEYRAGDARLALPRLTLVQNARGGLGFSGSAMLSGPLPGGRAERLALPILGNWSQRDGLAMWRKCTPVSFDRLSFANLTLDRRSLVLCPGAGGAIVRQDRRGLRIAAGTARLDLSGRLGSSPLVLRSGAVGLAWPGTIAVKDADVEIGDRKEPNRFHIALLKGQLGRAMSGQFSGLEARLAAVPLDLLEGQGNWNYSGGTLSLGAAAFRVLDREEEDRFNPLIARDATLTLTDGKIDAVAELREPVTDSSVATVTIAHDLGSSTGHADLAIPGIVFSRSGKKLQPDSLSKLTQGVIANAEGTITGSGRIDWSAQGVTSTGRFSTNRFDFAAPFGPTDGVSGTVEFTDLLGLVTAPNQRLKIAAINPGVEVNDGEASFELQPGHVLVVHGAHWPFVDGTLDLLPTRMVLGAAEVRRYTLKVVGADAAKFVTRLELGNIAATGIFDGELPIVFDEKGGHVEGGLLISRPPGGSLSYVGTLSYQDLSAMGNFAFDMLKSIKYKKMTVGMDGSLEGEIVTRVSFEGISQGTNAGKGLVSRYVAGQVAKLPLRFNVNIRAPFRYLMGEYQAIYDSAGTSAEELGLFQAQGNQAQGKRPTGGPPTTNSPVHGGIQPPESRDKP